MSDLARAAHIQQTLHTPGFYEIVKMADDILLDIEQSLSKGELTDEQLVARLREWRGAKKFWSNLKRAAEAATQIETGAE